MLERAVSRVHSPTKGRPYQLTTRRSALTLHTSLTVFQPATRTRRSRYLSNGGGQKIGNRTSSCDGPRHQNRTYVPLWSKALFRCTAQCKHPIHTKPGSESEKVSQPQHVPHSHQIPRDTGSHLAIYGAVVDYTSKEIAHVPGFPSQQHQGRPSSAVATQHQLR